MTENKSQEVVAIFHDEGVMEKALMALEAAGVDPDDIALLASCTTVQEKLGHRFKSVAELEDEPNAPRVAFIPTGADNQFQHTLIGALSYVATGFGLILASSSGLAPMLLTATAAGGAVASAGEALKWLVGHRQAHRYAEQLNCGGLLIWVRVKGDAQARSVMATIEAHGGTDVHLRGADTRESSAMQEA